MARDQSTRCNQNAKKSGKHGHTNERKNQNDNSLWCDAEETMAKRDFFCRRTPSKNPKNHLSLAKHTSAATGNGWRRCYARRMNRKLCNKCSFAKDIWRVFRNEAHICCLSFLLPLMLARIQFSQKQRVKLQKKFLLKWSKTLSSTSVSSPTQWTIASIHSFSVPVIVTIAFISNSLCAFFDNVQSNRFSSLLSKRPLQCQPLSSSSTRVNETQVEQTYLWFYEH